MLNARVKIRHLHAFTVVAQNQSFARAAETLAISQPAVSKTIGELEDILATRLFDRQARGVRLTPSGLVLLRHAGPALRALETGLAQAGSDDVSAQPLRIGALSTVETELLPLALQRWQLDWPTGQARVTVGASAFLLERLLVGKLDVVVGRMTDAREMHDLSYEHVYYEPLILVVRGDHPLAHVAAPEVSDLIAYPWVLPPPKTTLRPRVDAFWVRHGVASPQQRLETLSLPISYRYTMVTDAIWVAPRDAVRTDLVNGTLYALPVALETEGGSVGFALNTSAPSSLAREAFCEAVRIVAARRGAGET